MPYKNSSTQNSNNKKAIIAILALLLIGIGTYSFINNQKKVDITKKLTSEKNEVLLSKNEVLNELSLLEASYDEAISQKTELSGDLEIKKREITKYKNSLKKFKGVNAETISFFKKKTKKLNFTLNNLLVTNDSLARINQELTFENQKLASENTSLTSDLADKSKIIKLLTNKNKLLVAYKQRQEDEQEREQDLGFSRNSNYDIDEEGDDSSDDTKNQKTNNEPVIKNKIDSKVSVSSFNERRGRYLPTEKAKITNFFKVSFLTETNIPEGYSPKIYVAIKDPNGKVLSIKDFFEDANKTKISYSKASVIPYKKGKKLSTVFSVKINEKKLIKGKYTIDIYLDKKLVKKVSKTLS